ncbi:MAG: VTT domain-containing protein [Pseudomonadota bacterium]
MQNAEPQSAAKGEGPKLSLWLVLAGLVLLAGIFLIGRNSGLIDIDALQQAIASFAEGPWGVPALLLTFCVCIFIGVPQFLLIGVAVYAFGPVWGAVWSWVGTLCSGTVTFWVGRLFGNTSLHRMGEGRLKVLADFVARNAFAASAIVRNVPAGPALMVNMVFGAVRAKYWYYISGMALGIVPKIALIAFGLQAIQAALEGNIVLAIVTGIVALAVFLGGYFYVRHRRRIGDNIALNSD